MKSMIKRILAIVIGLALLALAACSDEAATSSSTPEPEPPLRVESSEPQAPSSDTPGEAENYKGLTKEEWDDLQKQKAEFEAVPDDEKQTYLMTNEISCERFIHLGWEHYIDNTLIQHVGSEQFESWITEQQANDKCMDIYSFAGYFSIDLETLISLIRDNNLSEVYPIDKLEARYAFMIKEAK